MINRILLCTVALFCLCFCTPLYAEVPANTLSAGALEAIVERLERAEKRIGELEAQNKRLRAEKN